MFSGRHELPRHNGKIFMDRDGIAFCDMLSYLRTGLKPPFSEESTSDLVHFRGRIISHRERSFYRELDYWQIPTPEVVVDIGKDDLLIQDNYVFNEFDPEWVA